jgi:hypothetical protein
VGPKRRIPRLRRGGYQDPAVENQRDLNDVDWRENYLLLIYTCPRYQIQIPGIEKTRCREFFCRAHPLPRRVRPVFPISNQHTE